MRLFHTRVGLIAGAIGAVIVFAAQLATGLVALFLVGLVGLFAGLSVAKWLPRDLFGRQFEVGVRAGVLACALAAAGFLASLALYGKHAIGSLAASSRFLLLDLGPLVRALHVAGWAGIGFAGAVIAFCIGTVLAAMAALLGSWDKNREAILSVERARDAAQRSARLAGIAGGHPSTGTAGSVGRAAALSRSTPLWEATPPVATDLAGLSGLNESFHSMRSPISMVPPPGPATPPPVNGTLAAMPPSEGNHADGLPMIDAASLVDSDAGPLGADLQPPPGPSDSDMWSAFASWREPEPAPPPAPVTPATPAAPAHTPALERAEPLMERAPEDLDPLTDGELEEDDELPSSAPRQRMDTDSWLC